MQILFCLIALLGFTYKGPTKPVANENKLVRIEILIRDSPDLAGVQIQQVTFNGEDVPLQPRDLFGNRGSAGFRLLPGKYRLKWKVQRDKTIWPRIIVHEEEVQIDPKDLWVQITIIGEDASIR